jgi:hypothetical protein
MNPTPAFAHPVPGRPEVVWAASRPRATSGASAPASPVADMPHPTPR